MLSLLHTSPELCRLDTKLRYVELGPKSNAWSMYLDHKERTLMAMNEFVNEEILEKNCTVIWSKIHITHTALQIK